MPTVSVSLDKTQYVQVNTALNPITLQAKRDQVRIALSALKPADDTDKFHILAGKDAPLQFNSLDTNVWVLAMSEESSLIVSETAPVLTEIVDTNGDSVIEPYSGAVITIESEHARIHQGKGFQLSNKITGLLSTESHYFLIDPSTPIHWRDYKFLTDGAPVDIELFENPTITANGTALTPLNRNRLSATVSTSAVYANPTVTSDGDRLYIDGIVGSGDKKSTGSTEGIAGEWIIDGGNTYLLKLTNNDTVTINYIYQFFWYEL